MRIDFRGYVPFHSVLQWLPGMFGYCKLYHPRIPEEHAARKVHLLSNHLKHPDFYECVPAVKAAEPHPESVLLQHRYPDNLSNPEKRRPFRHAHLYRLSHLCHPSRANHLHHLFRSFRIIHLYRPCLSNSPAILQLSPQNRFLWRSHKQNDRLFRLLRFVSLKVFSKAAYTDPVSAELAYPHLQQNQTVECEGLPVRLSHAAWYRFLHRSQTNSSSPHRDAVRQAANRLFHLCQAPSCMFLRTG